MRKRTAKVKKEKLTGPGTDQRYYKNVIHSEITSYTMLIPIIGRVSRPTRNRSTGPLWTRYMMIWTSSSTITVFLKERIRVTGYVVRYLT